VGHLMFGDRAEIHQTQISAGSGCKRTWACPVPARNIGQPFIEGDAVDVVVDVVRTGRRIGASRRGKRFHQRKMTTGGVQVGTDTGGFGTFIVDGPEVVVESESFDFDPQPEITIAATANTQQLTPSTRRAETSRFPLMGRLYASDVPNSASSSCFSTLPVAL